MAMPIIHVTEIPEEGLNVACEVQSDELTLAPDEARVVNALTLEANIFMTGSRIDVRGVLAGRLIRQCVRCLKDYADTDELSFAAVYRHAETGARPALRGPAKEIRKGTEAKDAVDESEADEDVYPCAGDRLDLSDMLREQIILATPMQPLCDEACPGLCPVCGRDRNDGDCGCVEEGPRNPFAVLRDIEIQSDHARVSRQTRDGSKSQGT